MASKTAQLKPEEELLLPNGVELSTHMYTPIPQEDGDKQGCCNRKKYTHAEAGHGHKDGPNCNKQDCCTCIGFLNTVFTCLCFFCGLFFAEGPAEDRAEGPTEDRAEGHAEDPADGANVNKRSKFTKRCACIACQIVIVMGWSFACLGHAVIAFVLKYCRIFNSRCFFLESENCTLPYEYWKVSTAVTLSAVAASVSYVLMTFFILIPANMCRTCYTSDDDKDCHKVCCTTLRKLFKNDGTFLSPFKQRDVKDQPTCPQSVCFYFNYIFSLVVLFFYTVVSLLYAGLVVDRLPCAINILHFFWYFFHAGFHLCAIHSCFIFSKVIYIATNKLEQISKDFDKDEAAFLLKCESEDIKSWLKSGDKDVKKKGQYYSLQSTYRTVVDKVKPTLNLLGYWFIAHWLLHALTTVLLTSVIIELVVNLLQYKATKADKMIDIDDGFLKFLYVTYLVFFALEHAFLFFYPCFRASSIASAHMKLVKKVLNKQWEHVPISVIAKFVQYLTSQNFAFKVSVFCVELSFGLSMACVSLILALYGGLIKLND